jgi:hypothetical protein
MANELLDFVMSLVRDPDAAARYAADPAQAIADAHLTDVSSVDVNNLIPMVSDSLSMAAPLAGGDTAGDGNVWTSGAATAAFDAFSAHVPDIATADVHTLSANVIDQPLDAGPVFPPDVPTDPHLAAVDPGLSTQFTEPDLDHAPADDTTFGTPEHDVWDHSVIDTHIPGAPDAGHSGFDIFD